LSRVPLISLMPNHIIKPFICTQFNKCLVFNIYLGVAVRCQHYHCWTGMMSPWKVSLNCLAAIDPGLFIQNLKDKVYPLAQKGEVRLQASPGKPQQKWGGTRLFGRAYGKGKGQARLQASPGKPQQKWGGTRLFGRAHGKVPRSGAPPVSSGKPQQGGGGGQAHWECPWHLATPIPPSKLV
jgi:hypothetical protein